MVFLIQPVNGSGSAVVDNIQKEAFDTAHFIIAAIADS